MRVTIEDFSGLTANLQKSSGGGQTPLYTPAGPARTLQYDYAGIGAFQETADLWEKALRVVGTSMKQVRDRVDGLAQGELNTLLAGYIANTESKIQPWFASLPTNKLNPDEMISLLGNKVEEFLTTFETVEAEELLKNPRVAEIWKATRQGAKLKLTAALRPFYLTELERRTKADIAEKGNAYVTTMLKTLNPKHKGDPFAKDKSVFVQDPETGETYDPQVRARELLKLYLDSLHYRPEQKKRILKGIDASVQIGTYRILTQTENGRKRLPSTFPGWLQNAQDAGQFLLPDMMNLFETFLSKKKTTIKERQQADVDITTAWLRQMAVLDPYRVLDEKWETIKNDREHPLYPLTLVKNGESILINVQTNSLKRIEALIASGKKVDQKYKDAWKLMTDNNKSSGDNVALSELFELAQKSGVIPQNTTLGDFMTPTKQASYNSILRYAADLKRESASMTSGTMSLTQVKKNLIKKGTIDYLKEHYSEADFDEAKFLNQVKILEVDKRIKSFDEDGIKYAQSILQKSEVKLADLHPIERAEISHELAKIISGDPLYPNYLSEDELKFYKELKEKIEASPSTTERGTLTLALLAKLESDYSAKSYPNFEDLPKERQEELSALSSLIMRHYLYKQEKGELPFTNAELAAAQGNSIELATLASELDSEKLKTDFDNHFAKDKIKAKDVEAYIFRRVTRNFATSVTNPFKGDVPLTPEWVEATGEFIWDEFRGDKYWNSAESIQIFLDPYGAFSLTRSPVTHIFGKPKTEGFYSALRNMPLDEREALAGGAADLVMQTMIKQNNTNYGKITSEVITKMFSTKIIAPTTKVGHSIVLEKEDVRVHMRSVPEIAFGAAGSQLIARLFKSGKIQITGASLKTFETMSRAEQDAIKDIASEGLFFDDEDQGLVPISVGGNQFQVHLIADTEGGGTILAPISDIDDNPIIFTTAEIDQEAENIMLYKNFEQISGAARIVRFSSNLKSVLGSPKLVQGSLKRKTPQTIDAWFEPVRGEEPLFAGMRQTLKEKAIKELKPSPGEKIDHTRLQAALLRIEDRLKPIDTMSTYAEWYSKIKKVLPSFPRSPEELK